MKNKDKIGIIFICMGNICRSPTAEAVFRQRVAQAGLTDRVCIDSAGTHDYHVGEAPDTRTQRAAKQRGYDMSQLRARQVEVADFQRFDYLLAMDEGNLAILHRLRPHDCMAHVGLFLDFAQGQPVREVPDPYYGGAQGFDHVLDLVEAGADGLLKHLRERLERPL